MENKVKKGAQRKRTRENILEGEREKKKEKTHSPKYLVAQGRGRRRVGEMKGEAQLFIGVVFCLGYTMSLAGEALESLMSSLNGAHTFSLTQN